MYPESSESFNIVREVLLDAIPIDISIKKSYEGNIYLVVSEEYNLVFLNETSSVFLSMCDGKRDVKSIINQMVSIYDVDKEILSTDITVLVRDLQKKRIIHMALKYE